MASTVFNTGTHPLPSLQDSSIGAGTVTSNLNANITAGSYNGGNTFNGR